MKKNLINLALALTISVAAFASQNIFSIWTNLTDASQVYVDSGSMMGTLKIKGFQKKVGSRTEKNVELRIQTLKKVGSRTELKHYSATIQNGSTLPMELKVFKTNSNWKKVGSSSEGVFSLNTADSKTISGKLLGSPISANAVTE